MFASAHVQPFPQRDLRNAGPVVSFGSSARCLRRPLPAVSLLRICPVAVARLSFSQHLLLVAVLTTGALAFIAARNWDTVSMMLDNASSMNEGASAAQAIRSPDDLLAYIAQHPDQVSLTAYDLNTPADGVYYQPDAPRALTRIPILQLLADYAEGVAEGTVDPTRRVPVSALGVYALPGVNQSSHEQMVEQWRTSGRIDAAETVALADVMEYAARTGGRTPSDWWMMERGPDTVAVLPGRLGLSESEPPLPLTGRTLLGREEPPERLQTMDTDGIREAAFGLTQRLQQDASFRTQQRQQFDADGSNLTLETQRDIALAVYPSGTTRNYAALLARIAQGRSFSEATTLQLHDMLERPVAVPDSVQAPFASVATYGGASPGLMSFVGYARYDDGRSPRVVALLMDGVPIAVMYHLLQTGIDKGFQLQLLSEEGYLQRVREALADSSAPSASAVTAPGAPLTEPALHPDAGG